MHQSLEESWGWGVCAGRSWALLWHALPTTRAGKQSGKSTGIGKPNNAGESKGIGESNFSMEPTDNSEAWHKHLFCCSQIAGVQRKKLGDCSEDADTSVI